MDARNARYFAPDVTLRSMGPYIGGRRRLLLLLPVQQSCFLGRYFVLDSILL